MKEEPEASSSSPWVKRELDDDSEGFVEVSAAKRPKTQTVIDLT